MATIKASVVEHVFRRVWEAQRVAEEKAAADARGRRGGGGGGGGGGSGGAAAVAAEVDHYGGDDSEEDDHGGGEGGSSAASRRVTKIHPDAVRMSSEFLRLFVVEALRRAQMEAMVDDSASIEPHHLEQILAQLLLDF